MLLPPKKKMQLALPPFLLLTHAYYFSGRKKHALYQKRAHNLCETATWDRATLQPCLAYGITTVHSKRLIEKVKLLFKNEKPMGHEKLHLDKKMLLTSTKDGNLS